MSVASMLLAQALWAEAAAMAFVRCECGNDQPRIVGRPVPDCESCGRPLDDPREAGEVA